MTQTEFLNNKAILIEKYKNTCQCCNKKLKRIETHHINKNHSDDRINNLMVVCPKCHKTFHPTIHYLPKFTKSVWLKLPINIYNRLRKKSIKNRITISEIIRRPIINKLARKEDKNNATKNN